MAFLRVIQDLFRGPVGRGCESFGHYIAPQLLILPEVRRKGATRGVLNLFGGQGQEERWNLTVGKSAGKLKIEEQDARELRRYVN